MKSHFAQSGPVFLQFWFFEAIFEVNGQNSQHLFCSVWTFYCTQNDRLNLTVSTHNSVWKTTHPGLRYLRKKTLLVWWDMINNIFANISAKGGLLLNQFYLFDHVDLWNLWNGVSLLHHKDQICFLHHQNSTWNGWEISLK